MKKGSLILLAIVLLALTLRLICFAQLKANYPLLSNPVRGTDMLTYHEHALAHLNGTFEEFPHYFNALYAYFLSLIYFIFGKNILIAKTVQIFLDVVNCLLIYFIAKELFNKQVGFIAAGISALYLMFIIYTHVLLVVTLLTFLITLALLLLLKIQKRPTYPLAFSAGIILGLAALARGSNAFFLPFIIVWLFMVLKGKGKRTFVIPLILLFASLSVISVVTIQNYALGGKFVPISANPGINFAIGNCPGAEGWFHYPEWLKSSPEREKAEGSDSLFWFKETLQSIQEEPARWLKLMTKKFFLFWHYQEKPNNINQRLITKHSSLLKHFPFLTFAIVVPFGLLGIAISAKQWRKLLLLYLFLFLYMCSIVFVMVLTRYRLPFVQMLIPFAAFTLYWTFTKIKNKQFKSIIFLFLLFIPAILLVRGYDIYQIIERRIYVTGFPYGTYIRADDRLIIRDDSGGWHGEQYALLDEFSDKLKKDIIIYGDIDLPRIENSYLEIVYVCPQKEGELILEVNNHPALRIKSAQLYAQEKISTLRIQFAPSLINSGKNEFVLSVSEGTRFIVLIDDYYHYRRSAFSADLGLNWDYTDLAPDTPEKDKGEYMVSLNLEFQKGGGQ